jgi:hypothetical protein
VLSKENRSQYRKEEQALVANRIRVSHGRYDALMLVMNQDVISEPHNVEQLAAQLAEYHDDDAFRQCTSMGQLVSRSTTRLLD